MNILEQHTKLIDEINKYPMTDMVVLRYLLMDISDSLAVIADHINNAEKGEKK